MKTRDRLFLQVVMSILTLIVLCWIVSTAYFFRPSRDDISGEEMMSMFTLSAQNPDAQLDDEFYTVNNLADYAVDDVTLAQIQLDAMTYVSSYFGGTIYEFGLDAVPVIINQKLYITKTDEGEDLIHGGAVYSADGRTIGIIIHMANIETRGVGQFFPKHAVFWVFVHEYVHCVRQALGVNSSETSVEEGETTLTTTLVLENVGIASDWYMKNLCTAGYREWAYEVAVDWGVSPSWL